jgi:hypothetical protein
MSRGVLDNRTVRALFLLLVVSTGAAGVRPAAAAREQMACLTSDDRTPPTSRVERACCCVEVPDGAAHRPPDTTGLRSSDDAVAITPREAGRTRVALPGDLVSRAAFRVWVPPPTLLRARTAFLC